MADSFIQPGAIQSGSNSRTKRGKHLRRWIGMVLLAGIAGSVASPMWSVAQPAAPASQIPPGVVVGSGLEDLPPPEGTSQTEWNEFGKFMKEHSRRKLNTFAQMYRIRPRSPRTMQLWDGLAKRYREIRRIEASDPARFRYESEAIIAEDEVYGVLQQLRLHEKAGADLEVQKDEAELREWAGKLVDIRQQWRQERLRRVQEELADLKVGKATELVREELAREKANGGGGKKNREDQIDQLISRFKQNAKMPPKLARPLPGGDRPPIETKPETLPTSQQ